MTDEQEVYASHAININADLNNRLFFHMQVLAKLDKFQKWSHLNQNYPSLH